MTKQLPEGLYKYDDLKDVMCSDFTSEKELCDYLEKYISDFCGDFLDVQYKSHERECKLIKTNRSRFKGNRRVDFLIKTQDGRNILIECKNPVYLCELSNALGQCLSYISAFVNSGIKIDRTILLSTKIDHLTTQIITDFNLPVEFMVMDKTKCLKFSHYGSRETNRLRGRD